MATAQLAGEQAPFLRGLLRRYPAWLDNIEAAGPEAYVEAALARIAEPLPKGLREARARVALATALGDLSGVLDLTQVTALLSDLAELALNRAVRAAIEERVPGAGTDGFAVLALGKLGSRELNYSSDIDLIYIFDGDRLPRRDSDDPAEAATRYARRITGDYCSARLRTVTSRVSICACAPMQKRTGSQCRCGGRNSITSQKR